MRKEKAVVCRSIICSLRRRQLTLVLGHPECMRCNDCNVQVNKGTIGPPKIINDIIRCDR